MTSAAKPYFVLLLKNDPMNAGHREPCRLPDAHDNDDCCHGDEHSDPRRHIGVRGVGEQGRYRHKPNNDTIEMSE
jgi:hypothetical protein